MSKDTKNVIFVIMLFFLFYVLFSLNISSSNNSHRIDIKQDDLNKEIFIKKDTFKFPIKDTLSLENLKKELIRDSIKFIKETMQIAILETGWLKSDRAIEDNNLFGLRTNNGYLKFDTWQECVEYYKINVQSRLRRGENYYSFLERINYCPDTNYINYLKTINYE